MRTIAADHKVDHTVYRQRSRPSAGLQEIANAAGCVPARRGGPIMARVAQARPARPHHRASTGSRSALALSRYCVPVRASTKSGMPTLAPASARPRSTANQCATAAPQVIASVPVLVTVTVTEASPAEPCSAAPATAAAAMEARTRTADAARFRFTVFASPVGRDDRSREYGCVRRTVNGLGRAGDGQA